MIRATTLLLLLACTLWLGSHWYDAYHISSSERLYTRIELVPGAVSMEGYFGGIRPSNIPGTHLGRKVSREELTEFYTAYQIPLPIAYHTWIDTLTGNPEITFGSGSARVVLPIWLVVGTCIALLFALSTSKQDRSITLYSKRPDKRMQATGVPPVPDP